MNIRIDRTRRRGLIIDRFPFARITVIYAFGRRIEIRRV